MQGTRVRDLARHLAASATVLCVLGLAAPLHAASILSVNAAFGAGHDGYLFDDAAQRERDSSISVVSSDATSFLTRFAATLAVDGGSSQNLTFDVDYVVTIAVDAAVGETWELEVDNSRYGALTLVDDDAGRAQARAQDVLVTVSGATLTSGTLDLAATANLNSSTGGYTDISQLASGTLAGVGAQTVTLQFNFQLRTHTIAAGGAGDEASVRMGLASNLSAFTAGDYPGLGFRTLSSDGQFVSARLVTPEPGTFLPVSLGLLGLAIFGRSRERMSLVVRFVHRRR
jgi:hypothetical protein